MEKKKNTKDIIGIILIVVSLISFSNQHTASGFIISTFVLLFGISLLSILYDKILNKVKIKNLNIILPIGIFVLFAILNGMVNNYSSNSNSTYDPKQRIAEIKEKLAEFEWPASEVAKLLPIPKSKIGVIEWEASYGFVIYVGETSKEDYNEYVNQCSEKGFNVDYRKGDNYYYAKNSDGYDLSLNYEDENIMFIRIDEPKKENQSNNDDNKNNNSNISISNDKLKNNFIEACKKIKLDTSKIKNFEKIDDWNSGPRYKFVYNGEIFILYGLDNGDISSITISNGNLDKIYLDGYEPLDVNDFIFNSTAELQIKAEEKIKEYINYPSTAKFDWLGYGYIRRYDIYQISGSFTANNALGVKIDHNFIIQFKKDGQNYNAVYLNVNNKNYIGSKSQLPEITRKEIQNNKTDTSDNSIVLKEGTLGTYGKKDKFDGEEYIRYYIPAGTYSVEAITKNAHFYIETKKLHKEDGFDTATTIRTIKMNNSGDKEEITITKDQCISLVVHTEIKLVKIK